ncbi:cytochrome P450 [Colletotrichum caudatum]|nr:cytochrome P450 [Colletotrichum caudatum]
MIDPKKYAKRRKLFARAFTSSLPRRNWDAVVRNKAERAVERIKADAVNGTADLVKWWTLMTTDVLAHLSFGESFDILELGEVDETSDLTEDHIKAEAGALIVAGPDTTSVTLTHLVWAALKKPDLQARLEEELAGVDDESNDATLERLPLLNAVIDETLRLYGAAPGSLPRSVPPGGATLGGHSIPEGTVVETQAYTLHRNPNVFPNPLRHYQHKTHRLDETRFLAPDSVTMQQKQLFMP